LLLILVRVGVTITPMKNCPRCKNNLPLHRFSKDKNRAGGFSSWCKSCCYQRDKERGYTKKYALNNREECNRRSKEDYNRKKELKRANARALMAKLREAAIIKLGGVCKICKFQDIRALQIDHVNGGGGNERKKLGPISMYKKVIKDNTEYYQLLCANCNWIKRFENKEGAKCL
jgi:hypothetical protein